VLPPTLPDSDLRRY